MLSVAEREVERVKFPSLFTGERNHREYVLCRLFKTCSRLRGYSSPRSRVATNISPVSGLSTTNHTFLKTSNRISDADKRHFFH